MEKISATFNSRFSDDIPEYTAEYLKRVESDAVLDRIALTHETTAWISSWSDRLGEIMKLTDNTVIEKILSNGLKNGDSIADTAKKISDARIRDPGYRARRVAITETLRAHSVAQQESFMQSPAVEMKLWRHSGWREFARENHMAIDGQTVRKDEPFTLFGADGGVYNPMYPRDIVLPAGESINCGCISEPIVSEYVLGLSLEERNALRDEAIAALNEEYDNNHDSSEGGFATYRREGNPEPFKELKERMTNKHVKNISKDMGLNMGKSKFVINKDEEMLKTNILGHTSDDGKQITLYPRAFTDRETLVKTMGHEYIHLQQINERGIVESMEDLSQREAAAYASEQGWWNDYVEKTGYRPES